jgi:hypothetical protein
MIRFFDWWTFRDVDATDIEVGAAGDEGYLLVRTRRRFKPLIAITVDRDKLLLLAETIRDTEPTAEPAGGAR